MFSSSLFKNKRRNKTHKYAIFLHVHHFLTSKKVKCCDLYSDWFIHFYTFKSVQKQRELNFSGCETENSHYMLLKLKLQHLVINQQLFGWSIHNFLSKSTTHLLVIASQMWGFSLSYMISNELSFGCLKVSLCALGNCDKRFSPPSDFSTD